MSKSGTLTPKQTYTVFSVFFIVLSLIIRIFGMSFISADYNLFLKLWYDEIKMNGGFSALGSQVGDYNIPYQIVIAAFTYINVYPLYCYKIFSIIFDYSLALGVVFLVSSEKKEIDLYKLRTICLASVLLLPSVFLNSAYWGQCDVIYVSFIVWSLYFFRKEKYTTAFLFLGFSFAFKLQVVFILPFAVYYCWSKKKVELVKLILIPAVGLIMSLPAVFMGRGLFDFISVYMNQSDSYQYMSTNAPNIWSKFVAPYETLKIPAVLITFILLGIVLLMVVLKKINAESSASFAGVAAWSAWTCVMFLPAMHERYFFIVDILMLILALIMPRRYLILFIAEEVISMLATYMRVMLFIPVNLEVVSGINILIYLIFTIVLFRQVLINGEKKSNPQGKAA